MRGTCGHSTLGVAVVNVRYLSELGLLMQYDHCISFPDSDPVMSTGNGALSAQYNSSSAAKTFNTPLQPISAANQSTSHKSAYLSDLRSKVSQLQDEVNTFLTDRMEQERAVTAAAGGSKGVDEDKEEAMYGEEDPENDG